MKHLILSLIFAVACFLPAHTTYAEQQTLTLDNFVLDSTDDLLTIRYGVTIPNLEQFRIALQKGAKLALICTASLSSPRSLWLDEDLQENIIRSEISLDRLTREFMLTMSNAKAPFHQRALKPLLKETWGNLVQPLLPISQLERGEHYVVTLNIRMEDIGDSSWLADSLFFWAQDSDPEIEYTMEFDF